VIPNSSPSRSSVEDRTHRLLLRTPLLRFDTAFRISFGDFLYGSAQRIILKIELCDFLDARQCRRSNPQWDVPPCRLGLSPLRAARTVSEVQAALIPDGSANFENAGSSRVIQSE